jgi:CubicO group peptidase (beta-lactamase class C family)
MIHGECEPRFAAVRDTFAASFDTGREIGASFAATLDGRMVVDLWGGHADAARTRAWERDTIVNVFSTTKAMTALCAHMLVDRGLLDVEAPVARYWPEFAQAGKAQVLVRHLLTHQAGLPALRDPVPAGGFYDWDAMVERLAAEAPFWQPGSRHGYHALTFGFLVGEVVRRVSGRSLGRFVADEIAGPLGLDLHVGLDEGQRGRVATLIPPPNPEPGDPVPAFLLRAMTEPGSIPALVMLNNGGYLVPGEWDSPAALAAELPASGGVMNARALAGLYRAIVHDRQVGRFTLDAEDIGRMAAVQSAGGEDAVLSGPGRWTLGFLKAGATPRGAEPPSLISLSEEAFGHTGNGGSIGFADPGCDMSFAYVMNRMSAALGLGPTGQSLVDATYQALGYRRARYDTWVR